MQIIENKYDTYIIIWVIYAIKLRLDKEAH